MTAVEIAREGRLGKEGGWRIDPVVPTQQKIWPQWDSASGTVGVENGGRGATNESGRRFSIWWVGNCNWVRIGRGDV